MTLFVLPQTWYPSVSPQWYERNTGSRDVFLSAISHTNVGLTPTKETNSLSVLSGVREERRSRKWSLIQHGDLMLTRRSKPKVHFGVTQKWINLASRIQTNPGTTLRS